MRYIDRKLQRNFATDKYVTSNGLDVSQFTFSICFKIRHLRYLLDFKRKT